MKMRLLVFFLLSATLIQHCSPKKESETKGIKEGLTNINNKISKSWDSLPEGVQIAGQSAGLSGAIMGASILIMAVFSCGPSAFEMAKSALNPPKYSMEVLCPTDKGLKSNQITVKSTVNNKVTTTTFQTNLKIGEVGKVQINDGTSTQDCTYKTETAADGSRYIELTSNGEKLHTVVLPSFYGTSTVQNSNNHVVGYITFNTNNTVAITNLNSGLSCGLSSSDSSSIDLNMVNLRNMSNLIGGYKPGHPSWRNPYSPY